MVKVRTNISGNRYGRLTVISQSEEDLIKPNGKKEALWLCKCDCGNMTKLPKYKLESGHTKSCGCYAKEFSKKNFENHQQFRKYNTYDLTGVYGIGYTSNTNKQFYFDKEDYDKIKINCWYEDNYGYAVSRNINKIGKSVNIKMHRLIMNDFSNKVIDHINHNTLDNRKQNLRIVTRVQNQMNMSKRKDNTSGFTGVHFNKRSDKWMATIQVNYKSINLGTFKNKEDAIEARKKAEEKYFGKYSYNNSTTTMIANKLLKGEEESEDREV